MSNQPLTLKRRDFLTGVLTLSAAGVLHLPALATPRKPVGADRFVFLSDIHIRKLPIRLVYTPEPFKKVVEQILAMPELPSGVVVCGDCAGLVGPPEDYALLAKLIEPLRQAGLPIYLILGNHDVLENLGKAFPEPKWTEGAAFAEPKRITVVSLPSVHLFLLDSKMLDDFTFGRLGKEQIKWLDKALKKYDDKPVICMAHHDPNFKDSPLEDYAQMRAVFKKHPQAKGYFFGHAHQWYQQKHEKNRGPWEVCLPSTAYAFKQGEPTGWVEALFDPKGVKLTLHALDTDHPQHEKMVELAW